MDGSRPLSGREAALADIAERRRRDPDWNYRTDPTYFGPFPSFIQMMSDADFDRYMAEKVARGEVRAHPYAPPVTEPQPTPRPRLPVRSALPFGQRLRELRRAVGWTQREIAAQLGVCARTVIRYERGQSGPIQIAPLLALRRLEAHGQGLDDSWTRLHVTPIAMTRESIIKGER
jgi:DNA-binding XRE family transcriptional regulator